MSFWFSFPLRLYCFLQMTDFFFFPPMCFPVLLPNKDTWMHHVTFLTREVLTGSKVKGRFHGRVGRRFNTWAPSPPFSFLLFSRTAAENWTFVVVSVILTVAGDYKWLWTQQCTVGANVTQQRPLDKKKDFTTVLFGFMCKFSLKRRKEWRSEMKVLKKKTRLCFFTSQIFVLVREKESNWFFFSHFDVLNIFSIYNRKSLCLFLFKTTLIWFGFCKLPVTSKKKKMCSLFKLMQKLPTPTRRAVTCNRPHPHTFTYSAALLIQIAWKIQRNKCTLYILKSR